MRRALAATRVAFRVAFLAAFLPAILAAFLHGSAHAQVTVRSSVTATRIPLGESLDWAVSVEGAMGVEEPAIPPIEFARVVSLGTSQNMSWVNGRMSARTVFQFRLTPRREGRFAIPSVTVRTRGRVYTTDPIPIDVTPAQPGMGPGLTGGAERLRLIASVAPREVVVGQPVVLTMRLYQGTRLLGEPQYTAPETPGFYAEPTGTGRTYYEGSGPSRWLIGERHTVLYPTTGGRLAIGPASMTCLVADLDFPTGREVNLQSGPQAVEVRSLPQAPRGYAGAVADAELSGTVDRSVVRADEAVQLTFRLSGTGNLRLAPLPDISGIADFEIFDRQVEDSLDVDSGLPRGTKIVRYTLLPRRPGALVVPPVRYVTYVPGPGYRTLEWSGLAIDVEPGLPRGRETGAGPERIALSPTADPGRTGWLAARPFAGAALILLGLALWFLTVRRVRDPERARARAQATGAAGELLAGLAAARARNDVREFWRLSEEALDGIEDEAAHVGVRAGEAVTGDLRAAVARARYAPGAGTAAGMDEVGRGIEKLVGDRRKTWASEARARRPRWATVLTGVSLLGTVAALALGVRALLAEPSDATLAPRLTAAAQSIRARRLEEARQELVSLWDGGAHRPGVALDLALVAYFDRRMGEATLWTERARRLDPRRPLVVNLERALVQEGAWKGLPEGLRSRTTGGEIAFVACVVAFLGLVALAFARRARGGTPAPSGAPVTVARAGGWTGRGLLAFALVLGVIALQSGAAFEAPSLGIVLADTPLSSAPGGGGDVELEAGRAVRLEGASAGWTRVRAGGQVAGFVPSDRVRAVGR
ncbi:MAG: BatD family protein [Candidatus Eiseniibacteriota bacterium]